MDIDLSDPGALLISLRRIENGSLLGVETNSFSLPRLNIRRKKNGPVSLSSSLDTGKLIRRKMVETNYLRRRNSNLNRIVPDEDLPLDDNENDIALHSSEIFYDHNVTENELGQQHNSIQRNVSSFINRKKRPRPARLDDLMPQQRSAEARIIDPAAESLATMQASIDQLNASLKDKETMIKTQLNTSSLRIDRSIRMATKLLPEESRNLTMRNILGKDERSRAMGLNRVFNVLEVSMRRHMVKRFLTWRHISCQLLARDTRTSTLITTIVRGFLAKRHAMRLKLMRQRRNSLLVAYGAKAAHHHQANRTGGESRNGGASRPSTTSTSSSPLVGDRTDPNNDKYDAAAGGDGDGSYAEVLDMLSTLDRAAMLLQRTIRGFITRRKYVPQIKRARAIRHIRDFTRRFRHVFRAHRHFYSAGQQSHAAREIQRVSRGRMGRKRVAVLRVMRNRRKRQERYLTPESIMEFYFEQTGAAIRIQQWVRRLPWLVKELFRRKYARMLYARWEARYNLDCGRENPFAPYIKLKGGDLPASILQREQEAEAARLLAEEAAKRRRELAAVVWITKIARKFIARRRAKTLLNIRNKEAIAAVKIQALVRRFITCRRLGDAGGARYRSLLVKKHKWPAEKSVSLLAPPKHRKVGFSFPHLKIGDKKNITKMETVVNKIQRQTRRFLAKQLLERLKERKRVRMTLRIQHWYLTWRYRRVVSRALKIIQPVWKTIMVRYFIHTEAATVIEKVWRGHHAVVRYRLKKRIRAGAVRKLQRMAKRGLDRRHRWETITRDRLIDEDRKAGKSEYDKTELYTHIEFLWNSARVTKKADTLTLELQRFFSTNSTQGFMDMNKVIKLCKETPGGGGLIDKTLTAKVVELQFAKVKAQTDKRIDYPRFMELMSNIGAIKFLGADPSLIGNYTETMDVSAPKFAFSDLPLPAGGLVEMGFGSNNMRGNKSRVLSTAGSEQSGGGGGGGGGGGDDSAAASRGSQRPPQSATAIAQQAQNEKIAAFTYGRLYGRPALLTKLVITILRTHPEYKKLLHQLHAKSSLGMARTHLEDQYTRMQRWLRQKMGMKRMWRVHERKLREKEQRRVDGAAIQIQRISRGFLGKRFALRTAQQLYSKFVDVESGSEYWYNPRSKASVWYKPLVLRHLDCGLPIRMPPADEQFVVLCNLCSSATARCYCYNCDAPMCNECYDSNHKGGKRRAHIKSTLDTCVQCDFQAGTRYCMQCEDCFCDTCYGYLHSRGRLRVHIFQRTCDVCEGCNNRSAQWCHIEGGIPQGAYCTVCYKQYYGDPDPDSGSAKRLKFRGLPALRMQQKQQEEENLLAIQEAFKERQAQQLERKKSLSALTIQRVYRGYIKRKRISRFVRDRRAFFKLREQERKYRENVGYQLLEFFGIAPDLKSDTPLERVLKMYPSYMHLVIEECVDYQWGLACELWRAQEEHIKQQSLGLKPKGLVQGVLAKLALRHAQQKLHTAEADLFHANTEHAAAEVELDDAEADEKKSGQAKLNRLRKALEVAREGEMQAKMKMSLMAEEVRLASEQVVVYTGPLGLPKLVADRRNNGKLLPFKVDVYRGRTLALSRWPSSSSSSAGGGGGGKHRNRNRRRSSINRRGSFDEDIEEALKRIGEGGERGGERGGGGGGDDGDTNTYDSDGDDDYAGNPYPGKWKKCLRAGDVIIVNGTTFRIVAKAIPTVDKLGQELDALWQHSALRPPEKSMLTQLSIVAAQAQMGISGKPLSAPPEQMEPGEGAAATAAGAAGSAASNNSRSNTAPAAAIAGGRHGTNSSSGLAVAAGTGSRPQTSDEKRPDTAQSKATSGGGGEKEEEEEEEPGVVAQAWSYVSGLFASNGDDDEDRITRFTEVAQTVDHLTLDKPWVLPDAKGLEVHKVVPDVFYMKPIREISRHMLNTYPTQKSVAIVAISLHKMAQSVLTLASLLFDDDSDSAASMRKFAASLEDRRDSWLKLSNTVVQMSWDNSIRRLISFSARMMYKGSRIATVALRKRATNAVLGKKKNPYLTWQKSKSKSKALLTYVAASGAQQELGSFFIDTQAPADVLRMYVQRRFRDTLNDELDMGDSFVFIVPMPKDKEEPLSRLKEAQTFTHKICVYNVDARTMEGANRIKIVKEKRAMKKPIAEFPPEEMIEDGDGKTLIAPVPGAEEGGDDVGADAVATTN